MSPPRITVNYPAETVFGAAFRRVCRLLGKIALRHRVIPSQTLVARPAPPHHSRMVATGTTRTPSPIRLLAVLVLGACSTVPPHQYPPFAEHDVQADFVVPADGRLSMPSSSRDLVLHELRSEPPPASEQLGASGERWWLFPQGTHVQVHCRFRAYAGRDGIVPGPDTVLPGSTALREVQHQ
jgi:hypothetical protein